MGGLLIGLTLRKRICRWRDAAAYNELQAWCCRQSRTAAEIRGESRWDRSSLTSVAGPVCGPLGYDAILDRGCGEPGRAIDLNGSVAVFAILPGLKDRQMEIPETDRRRRIEDHESCRRHPFAADPDRHLAAFGHEQAWRS